MVLEIKIQRQISHNVNWGMKMIVINPCTTMIKEIPGEWKRICSNYLWNSRQVRFSGRQLLQLSHKKKYQGLESIWESVKCAKKTIDPKSLCSRSIDYIMQYSILGRNNTIETFHQMTSKILMHNFMET